MYVDCFTGTTVGELEKGISYNGLFGAGTQHEFTTPWSVSYLMFAATVASGYISDLGSLKLLDFYGSTV